MRKRIVLGSALLALGWTAWAQDPNASPSPAASPSASPTATATADPRAQQWKGRYRLWISGDAANHQNSLEVEIASTDELEGTMEIDWSLSIEGRAPNADEIRHKVKFKARRSGEGTAFSSEVLVGAVQPKVYRFEIYPIEAGKSFSGVVSMGAQRAGVLIRRD